MRIHWAKLTLLKSSMIFQAPKSIEPRRIRKAKKEISLGQILLRGLEEVEGLRVTLSRGGIPEEEAICFDLKRFWKNWKIWERLRKSKNQDVMPSSPPPSST